jgi:hypothetical protein
MRAFPAPLVYNCARLLKVKFFGGCGAGSAHAEWLGKCVSPRLPAPEVIRCDSGRMLLPSYLLYFRY